MNENKEKLTYDDVLKPVETLNDSNIIFKQWTSVYKMSDDMCRKTAEEILLQPYMKKVYSTYDIEPQDVKEFIETVTQSRSVCENIILNNSNIFQQNKENSKDKNGDGKSDGDNTKIDTKEEKIVRKIQLTSAFERIMKSFAEQKAAEHNRSNESPKWYKDPIGWLKQKKHSFSRAANVFVITTGISLPIAAIAINKMNDYSPENNAENAKQRVTAKIMKPVEKGNNKTSPAMLELVKKSKETVKE